MLVLPENVDQFTCPHCGAVQSMAGEILASGKPEYSYIPRADAPLEAQDKQEPMEEAATELMAPVPVQESVVAGEVASG